MVSFENFLSINVMCKILIQNSENKSPSNRLFGFSWHCLYIYSVLLIFIFTKPLLRKDIILHVSTC